MRNKYRSALLFSLMLLCFLVTPALAWKSALPSNHRPITVEAISLLQRSDNHYPDITMFQNDIADWSSGVIDDSAAHGAFSDVGYPGLADAINFSGGPFERWWEFVKARYSSFTFNNGDKSAYYYVGLMAHLLEDQSAPPHAANVSQVWGTR